jgi:biopolymer transport protein ExbB/TolQ
VPAVIAYNLIMRSVANITSDMELAASEMSDVLRDK